MTPEESLLASILRDEQPTWPGNADPGFPDRLLNAAAHHGVAPLVHHIVTGTTAWETYPENIREALATHAKMSAATELLSEMEQEKVLAELANAGLHPLILKGTALAYSLYPAPYLRPRCDTDLLFPDRDAAEHAWTLLQKMGYQRPNAISGDYVSYQFSCYRSHPSGATHTFDMHWRLNNRQYFARALTYQEMEELSAPLPALGPDARALGKQHALMHALMHRVGHLPEGNAERLIWLYDIHLLAKMLSVSEWSYAADWAAANYLRSVCLNGLDAAKAVFRTPIPEGTKERLKEGAEKERYTPERLATHHSANMTDFLVLPWSKRFHFLREHIFPDRDYVAKKYGISNRAALPFLYLKRALGGLRKLYR